MGFEVSQR